MTIDEISIVEHITIILPPNFRRKSNFSVLLGQSHGGKNVLLRCMEVGGEH